MQEQFQYDCYLLKRQVLALTGKFRLYNPSGELTLFSQQKIFRLKEDIRVYADENMSRELLHIHARKILDFSAAYNVIDIADRSLIGALRRRGFQSMVRDEWQVFDASGSPLGVLIEDSLAHALLRRVILGSWLPQNYDLLVEGRRVADLRQRFNLIKYEMDIDFRMDLDRRIDRRLGIAAAILLATIEGRQK